MPAEQGILGIFGDPARAAVAVRALREAGIDDVRAASPAPFPELLEALGRPESRLGRATMSAAALGVLLGFALCIGTALAWPLVTGGKPIVSIPPFVIIAFELAVLVGAVTNLAALAVSAWLGHRRRPVPFDPRFSLDRIGVYAVCPASSAAGEILRRHGAEEVRRA